MINEDDFGYTKTKETSHQHYSYSYLFTVKHSLLSICRYRHREKVTKDNIYQFESWHDLNKSKTLVMFMSFIKRTFWRLGTYML